jgi:exopolyphosphatase/guanosine-5'-triphosphate,3'-diphosphate pyrophosphatase
VTLDGLKRLRKAVIAAGTTQRLDLPGIREERAQVLPGGLAILLGGFEALGIERLTAASGAMREGLLYDLLGRIRHEDVRDRTIRRLSERYHIDVEHAARVERTLLALWKQSALGWALESGAARQSLIWAARLHEAGLMITFSGYHKHGAYLVTHSDMPGFSSDDQLLLAALIQHHRRRLVRATFEALPGIDTEQALRLALLLRLAVLLNRARTPRPLPIVSLTVGSRSLALGFPAGWLGEHPLTRADLEDERSVLDGAGYELRFG